MITFLTYKISLHHRELNAVKEAYLWVHGAIRRLLFNISSAATLNSKEHPYYTFVLQVHNDYQISQYRLKSVRASIIEVMLSFSNHAPQNMHLIIKHHPLDIAYTNYSTLIKALIKRYKLEGRIHYILDGHLPTVLAKTAGVVCINSSVGLSALKKDIPVKVLGSCYYDIPGLTYSGSLNDFWIKPGDVDSDLCSQLHNYLLDTTQFNASVYCCGNIDSLLVNKTISFDISSKKAMS